MFKTHTACTVLLTGIIGSATALAADLDTSQGVLSIIKEAGGQISLSVSGPGDYQFSNVGSSLNGSLTLADVGIFIDGSYTYEVKEVAYGGQQTVSDPANGRESAVQQIVTFSNTTSGHFTVVNGSIVDSALTELTE